MQFLKDLFIATAYWTLPPGIKNLLKNAISGVVGAGECKEKRSLCLGANVSLKNKHKGERCFILATGPSVKKQDLSGLEGELCVAVSHFFLHRDIKTISPRYHVLAPYHPPFNFDDLQKVFSGFEQAYSDETTYVFGHRPYEFSICDFLKMYPEHVKTRTYFIDYSNSPPLDDQNHLLASTWDIGKKPFETRTVIYSAIQLAAYMGCKEIYLLGCDHDYLHDTKRVTNHHFYPEKEGVSDVDHLSAFTTERWFEEYYLRWKQYRLMREYLKSIGCEIYNSTHGGMLDVFPRLPLHEVLNDKQ